MCCMVCLFMLVCVNALYVAVLDIALVSSEPADQQIAL